MALFLPPSVVETWCAHEILRLTRTYSFSYNMNMDISHQLKEPGQKGKNNRKREGEAWRKAEKVKATHENEHFCFCELLINGKTPVRERNLQALKCVIKTQEC